MKYGCLIYILLTLGSFFIYLSLDESGYYRVIDKQGASLHSSVFASKKDSIGVIPFDTVVKIEKISNAETAEILIDGQKIYVNCSDLELVEKSNDMQELLKYICYAILAMIAAYLGYKYLREHHVGVLAKLKAVGYVILSGLIITCLIYAMKHPSSPPSLGVKGKSTICKQYDFEGYTPPLHTEVEVLCYVKYKYLVRDPQGRQFIIPTNALTARIKSEQELNEHFTYNVSKKRVDTYVGKNIRQFKEDIGDYITGLNNVYDFPYLIAIGNGERIHGLKVMTDNLGDITEIAYNQKDKSENIFGKLPFYETIACKNLYTSISMTGDNDFWERLFMVAANFLMLGLMIFIFARTASIAFLWSSRTSTSIGKAGSIVIWILLSPVIYIFSLAIMDFYHSMWIFVVVYLITVISLAYSSATENAARSIYKCPSCKRNGVYNPKEKTLKEDIVGTILYSWKENAETINGIKVPQKKCTKRISYTRDGRCKNCGYEDLTIYEKEETVITTSCCPKCSYKLRVRIEDGVYHETCPICHYELAIKSYDAHTPVHHDTNRTRIPHETDGRNHSDNDHHKDNSHLENAAYWKEQAKEQKQKASQYYDKYIEAVNRSREQQNAAESYVTQAKLHNDNSYLTYAEECRSKAKDYMSDAEEYYREYQYWEEEADLSRRNAL